jgi:integrase/recombinase XerD
MSRRRAFHSVVGPAIKRHLALKEALGRQYDGERRVLEYIDQFLTTVGADLTAETFAAWCRTQEHLSSGVRRYRMRVVRNLCLYRRRTEPSCFVPDQAQFPPLHQPVRPHIFTEEEIARLLEAASGLQPTSGSPLRSQVYRLAIVLLYTAGLRRRELVRLTVGDYDRGEGTLLIRASKFHKSRLVPLSATAAREVDVFLEARRRCGFTLASETPLLWNRYEGGRAYCGGGIAGGIRALLRTAGVRTARGRLPRIHDIRHAFAVRALARWYQTGGDVQAKLPFLAAYMGHVSIVSTQRYLSLVDALADSASDRFARRCGPLISPSPGESP